MLKVPNRPTADKTLELLSLSPFYLSPKLNGDNEWWQIFSGIGIRDSPNRNSAENVIYFWVNLWYIFLPFIIFSLFLFKYNGPEFRKCWVASMTSCLSFSFVNSRQTVTRNFFNFDPNRRNCIFYILTATFQKVQNKPKILKWVSLMSVQHLSHF